MLLNIPRSSLKLNSSLMLSCFLCATLSSDPYLSSRIDSSQSLYRDGPFHHPLYPRCQLQQCFFFFPQQLLSGMSDSRVNVERWKSTQILQTEEWAPSDVALCCGACLSTQQWPISPCPSRYHSRGHSPSTGCICAHWTIRGPSKCILIWCVQLAFAWTMAIVLGLFWKWIEYEVL